MKLVKTVYPMLAVILITGCTQVGSSLTPLVKTSLTTPVETPTMVSITDTPTSRPTPSLIFLPENTDQLIKLVMTKLNNGQKITEITTELGKEEIPLESLSIDFNGDGIDELFLTATLSRNDRDWLSSVYWIVSQSQDGYKIEYSLSPDIYLYAGQIYELGDLNGDKLPDLLVASGRYGNGCDQVLYLFGWRSTKYTSYAAETDLCIESIEVGEKNELVITGQIAESMDSGPTRKKKEYFQQNHAEYLLSHSDVLPSNYRIHVIGDAQAAYDVGNDALSVQLWDRAAHEQSLLNYPSRRIDDDKPEIYQPAFALYRLYTYYLANGEITRAEQYLKELKNLVGDETSPGGELLSLASEAKKLLAVSKDPERVCSGIYIYLNSTKENSDFMLDHWDWGALNGTVEFCPLRQK
jgi:hypothetical protein